MASFHKTNLGRFGESLPTDMDGYCHTTIPEWMAAPVDFGFEKLTRSELRDWAREKASEARAAVKASEEALADWQSQN